MESGVASPSAGLFFVLFRAGLGGSVGRHGRRTAQITRRDPGRRWLVAPYGEVDWVRNARAAGRVVLTRGSRSETVDVVEVSADEAGLVLKRYANDVPITRPFFDATPEAPVEAFVAEAHRHPVFRLVAAHSPS